MANQDNNNNDNNNGNNQHRPLVRQNAINPWANNNQHNNVDRNDSGYTSGNSDSSDDNN